MTSMNSTKLYSIPQSSAQDDASVLLDMQTCIANLRLGGQVLLNTESGHHLFIAVDGLDNKSLNAFRSMQLGRSPMLVLSGERADAIGLEFASAISVSIGLNDTADDLYALAAAHPAKVTHRPVFQEDNAEAALSLLMKAKFLPACLCFTNVSNVEALVDQGVQVIDEDTVTHFDTAKTNTLRRKSEAPIPVRGGINTRMVVFEYATGENEIALVVGQPNITKPLPIRIHSACATGDVFGSEKCDCGDQLRLAIEKLHEMGGGAILYLDQEGRGIGLTNKIRAYDLQSQSLDTVDANRTLGFEDDLRDYTVAAKMISALGWQQVSVLTNNPNKVSALEENGLEVVERVPHQAPMNENNSHYLKTKAKRSGHMLKYNK